MKSKASTYLWRAGAVVGLVALAASIAAAAGASPLAKGGGDYGRHSNRITNRWLPISKFDRCVLAGSDEGQSLRIVRTVRRRPRHLRVNGERVRALAVSDMVFDTKAKRLIEKTADFFAQDRGGRVHYLGEHVNEYDEHGNVTHPGAWLVGRHGAKPGLLMPAHPKVGRSFYSEKAPGITVERDTVVHKGATRRISGHTYDHVMRIREHATFPKPGDFERKSYAPGTGVISEANGGVKLRSCS